MIEKNLTPNYSKGWLQVPKLIVIHWTASRFESALSWLCNPKAQASAHFLIDTTGRTIQLVESTDRSWHAGVSKTKFGEGANNYSFGIELVGPPSFLKLTKWDERQLKACVEVCKFIKYQYGSVEFITDHSYISPGRKLDVRKGTRIEDIFPWDELVKETGLIDLK